MKEQIEEQIEMIKARLNEISEKMTSVKLGEMDAHEHGMLVGESAALCRIIVELQTIVDFC